MSLFNSNASKNSTAAPFLSEIGQTIDSTVRSLTSSNDSMVKSVLEQNKVLNDTIKTITDQMREMALVNKHLAETITDVTVTNKKMMEELNSIRKENYENRKEIKSELEAVREIPSVRGVPRGDFVDATATIYAGGQPYYHQHQTMQNQSFPLPPHQQQQQQMFYQPPQQHQQAFTRAQQQGSVYTNVPPSTSTMPFDQQQNLEFASYLYLAAQQQRQQELLQRAHHQASQMPAQVTPTVAIHPQAPTSTEDVSGAFTVPSGAHQQQQTAPTTVFPQQAKPKTPTTTAPSPNKSVFGQATPQSQPIGKSTGTKLAPAAPTFADMAAKPAAPSTPPKTTTSNIFTGFSFAKAQTTAAPPTTSTVGVTPTPAVANKGFASPAGGIFGKLSSSSSSATSFGQVAASAASKDEKKMTTPSSAFVGAGQPVFGSKVQKSPSADAKDQGANDDEHEPFEPTLDFKPLVPLPALVEVKTGEEDEEVLFEERAKLYRFDQETKEFKERGLGDMKLLKNEQGRVRVLMRREQTLKLCANHNLAPQMKLLPLSKSDRAFTWQCNDFSDNELKVETLAVKFKSPDMASKFKQAFEQSVLSAESSPRKSNVNEVKKSETTTTTAAVGFGDKFKKAPGSWNCPACCTNNAVDKIACACCGATKDGKTAAADKPSQFSGFKFSTPPGTAAAATPSDSGSKISFGFGNASAAAAATPKSTPTAAATTTPAPALAFGFKTPNQSSSSSIFGFATPTNPNSPAATTIFGKSSTTANGDGKNDVIHVVDSTTTTKSCPGCMGCSMSDAEIDKVFEKINELAKDGPQYPVEFNDDDYDDKNLMIEIDP